MENENMVESRMIVKLLKQHNDLIKAPVPKMSVNAKRFFILALLKIDQDLFSFQPIVFTLPEIKKALNLKKNIDFAWIEKISDELLDKVKHLTFRFEQTVLKCHLISSILIDKKKRKITILLDSNLTPALLGLKAFFTEFNPLILLNFNTDFSIKMYSMLRIDYGKKKKEFISNILKSTDSKITLYDFRIYLDLQEKSYDYFSEIERTVLIPIQEEFKNNILAEFDFSYITCNKLGSDEIESIMFTIYHREIKKEKKEIKKDLNVLKLEEMNKKNEALRDKYIKEVNISVSELIESISKEKLEKIKKIGGLFAVGLTDDELLKHKLFKSWVLIAKVLPDKKRYLDSFEDWCKHNELDIN